MTFALWLTLLGACSLISLTPGAGAISVMTNTLTLGLRRSIWGIAGQQIALVAHIAIVAAGLGVLVASSPVAFTVITYAGAAYLIYLGIRQLLSRAPGHTGSESVTRDEPWWSILNRGFWVNFTNPKAIIFFLAFLPQFIRTDRPILPQYLIVTATVLVVDVLVMSVVFGAGARGFRNLVRSPSGQRRMSITFGCLFIALGISLALL